MHYIAILLFISVLSVALWLKEKIKNDRAKDLISFLSRENSKLKVKVDQLTPTNETYFITKAMNSMEDNKFLPYKYFDYLIEENKRLNNEAKYGLLEFDFPMPPSNCSKEEVVDFYLEQIHKSNGVRKSEIQHVLNYLSQGNYLNSFIINPSNFYRKGNKLMIKLDNDKSNAE